MVFYRKTYLEWLCLIEIMVFLEMGGEATNLEVKLLDQQNFSPKSSLVAALETFDPGRARCFTDYATERLRAVLEVTGYDRITQLVHQVFISPGATA